MVTYNNSRQKIGEINVVIRPGQGVVTTVYTLAGPNSFLGFRSGLVSPGDSQACTIATIGPPN